MPLYEYKCSKCGQVFEIRQSFSDAPVTRHDSCGGAVEKLLSAPALQFKGTGWYITDYARGGGKSSEPGKTETKTETKTESKPDSASASTTSTSGKSDTK